MSVRPCLLQAIEQFCANCSLAHTNACVVGLLVQVTSQQPVPLPAPAPPVSPGMPHTHAAGPQSASAPSAPVVHRVRCSNEGEYSNRSPVVCVCMGTGLHKAVRVPEVSVNVSLLSASSHTRQSAMRPTYSMQSRYSVLTHTPRYSCLLGLMSTELRPRLDALLLLVQVFSPDRSRPLVFPWNDRAGAVHLLDRVCTYLSDEQDINSLLDVLWRAEEACSRMLPGHQARLIRARNERYLKEHVHEVQKSCDQIDYWGGRVDKRTAQQSAGTDAAAPTLLSSAEVSI